MRKEFIWDFDGTLFDTYPVMVRALVNAVAELGGSAQPSDVYRMMREQSVGVAEEHYAQKLATTKVRIKKAYQVYEQQLQQHPQAFPGAAEVVKQVIKLGGHNFLLTHRDRSALQFLEQQGLSQYFTDYVTSEMPFPRKPAPDSLNFLIDRYHLDRQESVMVGDRNLDVDAGHNAGIAGYLFDPDKLITVTSKPEVQVQSLTDLLPLLQ